MRDILKFIAYFGVFFAVAYYFSVEAFFAPKSFLSIADLTVTAISIIFGLSLTVASLAANSRPPSNNVPADQTQKKILVKEIARDNGFVVVKQKLVLGMFLVTIMAGISFKYSTSILPNDIASDWPSSIAAALFVALSIISFGAAILLPDTLFRLHRRNQHYS